MANLPLQELVRTVGGELADLNANDLVLVGCSGGADSLALAAACGAIAASGGPVAAALIVDHQLQPGSADVAQAAATKCEALGLAPVGVVPVTVDRRSGDGLEAAARQARRAALLAHARELDAKAILLAHTVDDQAETVLLRLSRGSGSRSLAAMAPADGIWRRPILSVRRAETHAVCRQLDLQPHSDPHNNDPTFARVRVRDHVLPALVDALGEAVVSNLARTATLCRSDNEALDALSIAQADARLTGDGDCRWLDLAGPGGEFARVAPAVRTRTIRLALIAGGCPPGSLTARHVGEVDKLVVGTRDRGPTRVPGDIEVARESDKLAIYRGKPFGSH